MDCRITLIPGDGIGPEIVTEAVKVLDAVAAKYGHKFDYTKILMGGCSIDECGVPLTDEAVAIAKASDAVLLLPEYTFSPPFPRRLHCRCSHCRCCRQLPAPCRSQCFVWLR